MADTKNKKSRKPSARPRGEQPKRKPSKTRPLHLSRTAGNLWRTLKRLPRIIKLTALVVGALLLLLPTGRNQAERPDPPQGFGGTQWGQEVAGLGELEELPGGGQFELRRPQGELSYEGEPLEEATLMLYEGKLAGVSLWVGSQRAFDDMVARLSSRYGPPRHGEALTWDWPEVGIAALFLPAQSKGVINFAYKPLALQAAEMQDS